MIYYIATIENGQIKTLKLPKGNNEPEGLREDGTTIVHIDFPIEDRFDFINTHFWDGEWRERVAPPNRHAQWTNGEWTFDQETLLNDVKIKRNELLASCDWTQVTDSPLTDAKKTEWSTYRQQLRDLPSNVGNISSIDDVTWPTEPA